MIIIEIVGLYALRFGTQICQMLPMANAEGHCFLSFTQSASQGFKATEPTGEQKWFAETC